MAPSLLVRRSSIDDAFGSFDRVFLILWRLDTKPADVVRAAELCVPHARDWPRMAMLTVVSEACPMPSAETRAAIAKLFSRFERQVVASALAFEGEGFRAAAVRGVVTGIAQLFKPRFPHVVFADTRAAASWLVPEVRRAGVDMPEPEAVVDAMEQLRRSPPTG